MNELFRTILAELKEATGATKALAGLVGAAVVGMIGIAAVVSNRPDFQPAFSELSAAEMSAVTKALSSSGIAFEVSQPPHPFVVFVDDSDRSAAMAAAYGEGALDKPIGGILADQGAKSIFLGNEERRQAVRKREWQETEGMLESLDFVLAADVRTSPGDPRPLLGRPAAPTTASVTLRLAGREPMDPRQSKVVSRLVSRGLGVEPRHIAISDQLGTLYDGAETEGEDLNFDSMLSYKRAYDTGLEAKVNRILADSLGPNKAYVTVDSHWDFDQSVTRTETSAEGGKISEDTVTTEQPVTGDLTAGGVAGLTSNVAPGDGFGTENAGVPDATGSSEPQLATSEEKRTQYRPSVTYDERVRSAPKLQRLSVALVVDESIEDVETIKGIVSAAVNLDELRQDVLTAASMAFPQPEVPAEGEEGTPADAAPAAPNPLMETLLTRGVEIVTAIVFLFLLLRSLKSAGKAAATTERPTLVRTVAPDGTVTETNAGDEPSFDPELLARMQVEQLLDSDPEKVGAILSSWARGEDVESGTAA